MKSFSAPSVDVNAARVAIDRPTFIIIGALVVCRIWLGTLPVAVWDPLPHDDSLFIRGAYEILHGHWLGAYDETTLVKGPFLSIFLAAVNLSGLPLKLVETAIYAASCLLMIYVIRPFVRSPWALIAIFTLLLFQPHLMPYRALRITRGPLYTTLSLAAFACAFRAMSVPGLKPRLVLAWSAGSGLLLAAASQTREEREWLLPAFALMIIVGFVRWTQQRGWAAALRNSAAFCLPLISIPIATFLVVASLNYVNYGIFGDYELLAYPFRSALGALQRIEHNPPTPFVLVPKSVREQAYQVSPAFQTVRSLEDETGKWGWAGCIHYPQACGDIGGAWFLFALREAAARAGHHRSAQTAAAFYLQVAKEINAACDDGRLRCAAFGPSILPPIANWGFDEMKPYLIQVVTVALGALGPEMTPLPGFHSEKGLQQFLDVINSGWTADEILRKQFTIQGWVHRDAHEKIEMDANSSAGKMQTEVTFGNSPGVAALVEERAGATPFVANGSCDTKCIFTIRNSGAELLQVDLISKAVTNMSGSHASAGIERQDYKFFYPTAARQFLIKLKVQAIIAQVYEVLLPIGMICGVLAFVYRAVSLRMRLLQSALLVGAATSLVIVLCRVIILGIIHVTWFKPLPSSEYWAPATPFLILFIALTLASIGSGELGTVIRRGSVK